MFYERLLPGNQSAELSVEALQRSRRLWTVSLNRRPQDTSTGAIVAQHRTRMGTCDVLRQNPWNAVVQLGHSNGVVSMWTPNMSTPIVKMLCHKVRLPS